MLKMQIHTMLRLRGITTPYTWLCRHGIAPGTARKILTGEHRTVSFDVLEILCEHLHCTPNELLEWQAPDSRAAADHPLQELRAGSAHEDLQYLADNLAHMSVAALRKLSRQTRDLPQQEEKE